MPYQILGDVHTHTLYSRHAYSTIQENVEAAAAAGLEILGSSDHFSCMLFPEQHLRNFQYFTNMGIWPRTWHGVTLLHACEADIVGLKGELFGQDIAIDSDITGHELAEPRTLFDRVASGMDYMVASVHDRSFADGASLAQTTEMYIHALENPKVFILGHTGRAGVPYDLDEVLTCAKERHKLIEINEHSLDFPGADRFRTVCAEIAQRCAELGVGIAVNSDAHMAWQIGRFDHVKAMLEEIHFPEELIMNRGREPFLRELAAAGVWNQGDSPLGSGDQGDCPPGPIEEGTDA